MENIWRVIPLVPFFIGSLVFTAWFIYECIINRDKPWSCLVLSICMVLICSVGMYRVYIKDYSDGIKKDCTCGCCVHK